MFTDGVSEAADGTGEHLGEDRLETLVRDHCAESATQMRQTIIGSALAHSGGELEDDLTLVILAVRESTSAGKASPALS